MSSPSDSEDDYYCNAAQKLQKLKDLYNEDKIACVDLVDTTPGPQGNESLNISIKDTKCEIIENENCNIKFKSLDDFLPATSNSNANGKQRMTRSRAKKAKVTSTVSELSIPAHAESENSETITARPRSGRKTRKTISSGSDQDTIASVISRTPRRGCRGRGNASAATSNSPFADDSHQIHPFFTIHGSSGRRPPRRRQNRCQDLISEIISIGNTFEYPDQSENQPLFTTPNEANSVIIVDEKVDDFDNEILSVKIYWQNWEHFKFAIRRYQKITQIFEFFSKKENVEFDRLLFMYNDKILKPSDTPDSIDYNIAKFIDGGVTKEKVSQNSSETRIDKMNTPDCVKIKFQHFNSKKPFELSLNLDEKLNLSLIKCAEHLERPIGQLKFLFDGEQVTGQETPRELEFEGGECIDVLYV